MEINAIATVVTRNRPRMLDKALELLSKQSRPAQAVMVVDNDSQPETKTIVSNWQKKNQTIHYFNTGRNAGSGGGQMEALKHAVEHHYDVVWTMDDDCEPQIDALKNILIAWERLENRGTWALNSMVYDVAAPDKMAFGLWDGMEMGVRRPCIFYPNLSNVPAGRIQNGLYAGWGCLFNGTLVPTELIRKIGYPDERLFIRGDEVEYFYRLSTHGRVGTVLDSIVLHPGEAAASNDMALWKRYFSARNAVVVDRKYFPSFKSGKFYLTARILRYSALAALGRLPAVNRTRALAVKDAMNGRFDRDAFALK